MNVIGDPTGKTCILVDDIVDSGGTLCNAADALIAQGAKDVYAYITHGVLSGGAVARIAKVLAQGIGRYRYNRADRSDASDEQHPYSAHRPL